MSMKELSNEIEDVTESSKSSEGSMHIDNINSESEVLDDIDENIQVSQPF